MDKVRPLIGVGIAVLQNQKILLGKRMGSHGIGLWGFPGGHLEMGEKVEECASRELLEETGLKIVSCRLGPWVENVMENNKHYITIFVFVDAFEGELLLTEPQKCEGWQWFHRDSLPFPLFPPIEALIKRKHVPLSLEL